LGSHKNSYAELLKIYKLFSSQTKAIGKPTSFSKTFMFTPKTNSKHKRMKKVIVF